MDGNQDDDTFDMDVWMERATKTMVQLVGPRLMAQIERFWVIYHRIQKLNRWIERLEGIPDGRVMKVRLYLIKERDQLNLKRGYIKDYSDRCARSIPVKLGSHIVTLSPWEHMTLGGFRKRRYKSLKRYRSGSADELEYYLLTLYYHGQDDALYREVVDDDEQD
jgi:hypothetical protein